MKYFARKVGFFLLTLWAVTTLNFLIPRLQPGDPAEKMVQALAGKDAQLDPGQVAAMRALLGAPTGSLLDQYGAYLGQVLRFDFGISYTFYPFSVTDVIGTAPVGVLNEDLRLACLSALTISPQACLEFAARHTWEASARAFVENITDIRNVDPESDRIEFAAEHPRFVA